VELMGNEKGYHSRDTKTFSMIWKKLSKWYDGGGENGII
jgi:hypothetical protein